MTTVAPLAPEVIDRLKVLQDQDRPVSVDEILVAANLNHLTQQQQQPSKSTSTVTTRKPSSLMVIGNLEKSVSTSTLAERRRLPLNPEKLKLYSQITSNNSAQQDSQILKRLEEQNAKLPAQYSEEYMVAHLERQNALLNADPKSICIESNRLQADFVTIRNLVSDATFSPTREDYEQSIQAMLAKAPLTETDSVDDWDFWQEVVRDFPTAVAKLPHLLAAKLRCGGIPHRIRGVIWQAMAQSSSLNLETLYTRLSEESESSSYERVIQRDLSRTFPQLDMFKDDGGEGQLAMGRLLKAYSLYDAHVGYCQGLAFLVGPLLMTMPENQAFCVFVRLMETYEMRTMFTLNMEGLHLRLHQFGVLLSQLCPRLDAHLTKHSIHTAMYASQWYLTLFAYSFPISLVLRIYDLVFAEGAVETITRVAVAIMRKNEDTLLEIDDFEQLMMYLSSRKLYQVAYQSDPEAVMEDTMALSAVITKQKMDNISEAYYREIEQEKTRAQQVLAIRFGGWGNKTPTSPTTTTKKNKRDSWFSWGNASAAASHASVDDTPGSEKGEPSSLTTSQTDIQQPHQQQQQDRTIPLLHEQIEDLVTALSQLQKENTRLSEDIMARQMTEMDLLTERNSLLQKNALLERKMNQISGQDQPSPVESVDGDTMEIAEVNKLESLQKQAEFRGFVDSLKLSGDFGTLIAGALTVQEQQTLPSAAKEEQHQEEKRHTGRNETGFDEVTSELVAIKLANFEMGLKYQSLCQENEKLKRDLKATTEGQAALVSKIMSLQTTIESMQIDQEQILQERDDLVLENEELTQKTLATKKTCADLQLEKLSLDDDCQRLRDKVKELEDQRREYLMPRGSFTEEVFAAHQTLFGSKPEAPPMSRRHTVQAINSTTSLDDMNDDVYQKKYIESDLRCRELEKLLAETKFRLVEYEAAANNNGSTTTSPRGSLQQTRRPTSLQQTKRSSLSMLVKVNSNNSTSGPHSPPYTDSRESTESHRSSTSSCSQQQKRSSVYSRFLNALGTGPLPEEESPETAEELRN
ncbi:hypothetical protein HMPREF1544_09292 [Mucor circinelloides 1006PhL]|uniref:Rab-GAP TBC domain-containing protein n=1 Tax=Mucor circinelloides f. circinelloides (strain 1006PhL) TaxID=1220926 RepID=S2JN16_MUCC1|nr:hypothetical protein HMPREF1544_09292 [Mucor circinelloides 1006PhL]